ncbi:MAG: hypothetical protein J6K32_05660 [Clostridia bacterium]|nr:hypothetical protein [Clostridia bacterium]
MKYKNAAQHLPEELLSQVQQYVDGEYLYIPRAEGNRRAWGEGTMTRRELRERDAAICEDHRSGKSARELADAYYLSVKSVQRILARHKTDKT